MYEIAICDDDKDFTGKFQAQLAEVMNARRVPYRVSLFSDPDELFGALERGKGCDLIFQDILFGTEKGVRFARALREKKWDIDVVFVTTSPEYAVESFTAFPLNYLLKPVARQRLEEVVDRFLERRAPRMLCLSTSRGVMRIPASDVLYFEIYSHTIIIHRRDGGSASWTGTLKDLEGALPANRFVRSHRSYLVNLEHVAEVAHTQLKLSSGDTIPISKSAYLKVQLSILKYDDRTPFSD